MGAKASRERVESPSAVMIVLAGGKVETYNRPVSAREVMLQHPEHVLAHPDVLRSDIGKALVPPETVLLPGNKYFLVPYCTVKWLIDCHASLIRMPNNLNDGIINSGYGATNPIHGAIHPGYGTDPIDGVVMPFHGSTMASSRQPQVIVKHRPSITVTIKQPHPARGRIAKGRTGKSPLRAAKSSESFQRSRRSSPKVCPGEEGSVWLEQEFAISPSFPDREAMVKDEGMAWKGKTIVEDESAFSIPREDDGQLSIINLKSKEVYQEPKLLHCRTASKATSKMNSHATLGYHLLQLSSLSGDETNDDFEEEFRQGASFKTSSPLLEAFPETSTPSPKDEVLPCSLPWSEPVVSVIMDYANTMLQKEKDLPELIRVRDLLNHQPNLLQEPEGDPQNMSLFELLKTPDLNLADLFEDWKVDSPSPAPSADMMDACGLHEADVREKEDTSGNLLLEPSKVHDQEGFMLQEQEEGTPNQALSKVVKVSELHQQKEFKFHVSVEHDDHQDLGVQTVLKLHNMVQADENEKEWRGSPLIEDNQDQELQRNITAHDVVQASVCQQKSVAMEDHNLAVPTLPDIETGELQGVIQDQQKDMQVCMGTENCHDQRVSNLSLPSEVVGLQKSVQPCVCMEEEVILLGCHPEKILSEVHGGQDKYVVHSSTKARPSEEVNLEQRLTLSDYFLQRSPNHQHMIDLGVVTDGMNQCLMSGTSSTSSSSSSWLMGIVSPQTRRSDQISVQQVKTGARKQQNLAILGFNSLRSDSLSIFKQVKAHQRAHRVSSCKASSSCPAQGKGPQIGSMKSEVQQSSKMEQEQGQQRQQQHQRHLQQQQEQEQLKMEKQQALPPAPLRRRPPPPPLPPATHHLGLPPRFFPRKIRPFRYRPPRKPLSPIIEISPEISSTSASPLNSYPSL